MSKNREIFLKLLNSGEYDYDHYIFPQRLEYLIGEKSSDHIHWKGILFDIIKNGYEMGYAASVMNRGIKVHSRKGAIDKMSRYRKWAEKKTQTTLNVLKNLDTNGLSDREEKFRMHELNLAVMRTNTLHNQVRFI